MGRPIVAELTEEDRLAVLEEMVNQLAVHVLESEEAARNLRTTSMAAVLYAKMNPHG